VKKRYALLLFVCVSFGLYANVLNGGFIFDDHSTFRRGEIREQPFSELFNDYRPLRYVSYRIDERLLGSDRPWVYHAFNTLYHGLTAFTVFLLLRQLAGEKVALAGALLFAAHPVQTESVAYLSGRRDVLSTLFFLLGLLAWTRVRTSWFVISPMARARWLLPALGLFVTAMLTKEMAATLPLVCLLFDAVLAPARWARRWRATALWPRLLARGRGILQPSLYAAGAAAGVLGVLYVLTRGATKQDWWGGSITSNFATSAGLLSHYARLILFPLHLLGDHSYDAYPVSHSFLETKVLLSLFGLAFGITLAIRMRRRAPLVTFGLAWFLITLLPVLHIRPFHEIAADHYLYLPSVGFCLLAGLGFEKLHARFGKRLAWVVLGLVLAAYATRTVTRNRVWQDEETFWRVTISDAPRCARAYFNLGALFGQRAKKETNAGVRNAYWREAAHNMEKAVEIRPGYAVARTKLGGVLRELGEPEAARAQWEEALRIVEPMEWPAVDPGLLCVLLGQPERALRIYEENLARGFRERVALKGMMQIHTALGTAAAASGNNDLARSHLKKALEAAERMLLLEPKNAGILQQAAELAHSCGDRRREAELRAKLRRVAPSR